MICGWQLRWSASFILRRVTVLQTIPQNKPESWPVWSAEECKIFLTIRWCVLLQSLLLWVKVRVRMHGNVCVTHWRMRHVSGWGYLLHTHFIFKFKHSINALHIFWLSGNLHSWKNEVYVRCWCFWKNLFIYFYVLYSLASVPNILGEVLMNWLMDSCNMWWKCMWLNHGKK